MYLLCQYQILPLLHHHLILPKKYWKKNPNLFMLFDLLEFLNSNHYYELKLLSFADFCQ
jgi:hypothetical protein